MTKRDLIFFVLGVLIALVLGMSMFVYSVNEAIERVHAEGTSYEFDEACDYGYENDCPGFETHYH
jgi:Na+-transporting methylmalonyl-CoA/oxaloacetate decarboxylase gamma subunit